MLDTFIGDIHYDGEQEIDTSWEASVVQPWLHQMVKARYSVYAGPGTTDFDAGQIVRYVHRDSGEDVTFQPQQIQWVNDLDQVEAVADPQGVGHSAIDVDTINWVGAYGPGLDFRWQAQATRLAKYLTIQSGADIGAPSPVIVAGGGAALRVPFIFQKSGNVDIYIDDVLWDEKSNNPQVTSGNVEFSLNGDSLWWFKQASARDGEGDVMVQQRFRKQGNSLFVEVIIPWSWLETATYPVVIDPTVDPQVGASSDDGEQDSSGNVSITITTPTISQNEIQGARWTVNVPNGATIDVSYASYESVNANRLIDYDVYVEDIDDAPTISASSLNISNRTAHATSVAWYKANSGSGWEDTPSLNTPIEGVIGRAGWAANQHLFVYFYTTTASPNFRVTNYDSSSSLAPKLHIEYTTGGGGDETAAFALDAITDMSYDAQAAAIIALEFINSVAHDTSARAGSIAGVSLSTLLDLAISTGGDISVELTLDAVQAMSWSGNAAAAAIVILDTGMSYAGWAKADVTAATVLDVGILYTNMASVATTAGLTLDMSLFQDSLGLGAAGASVTLDVGAIYGSLVSAAAVAGVQLNTIALYTNLANAVSVSGFTLDTSVTYDSLAKAASAAGFELNVIAETPLVTGIEVVTPSGGIYVIIVEGRVIYVSAEERLFEVALNSRV